MSRNGEYVLLSDDDVLARDAYQRDPGRFAGPRCVPLGEIGAHLMGLAALAFSGRRVAVDLLVGWLEEPPRGRSDWDPAMVECWALWALCRGMWLEQFTNGVLACGESELRRRALRLLFAGEMVIDPGASPLAFYSPPIPLRDAKAVAFLQGQAPWVSPAAGMALVGRAVAKVCAGLTSANNGCWSTPSAGSRGLADASTDEVAALRRTFIARLEGDLFAAVLYLESVRHHLAGEREESLRSRLVGYLQAKGYDASAETDEGGHVDILVRSAKLGLLWIGECKVHGAYEDLAEGMLQLHTRYASGRYPSVGFIIFCFNQDAASVVATWKTRLSERKLCGMIDEPVDDPRHALSFTTRHIHAGSGLEVVTRHVVVPLYWVPEDKSGRKSRAE